MCCSYILSMFVSIPSTSRFLSFLDNVVWASEPDLCFSSCWSIDVCKPSFDPLLFNINELSKMAPLCTYVINNPMETCSHSGNAKMCNCFEGLCFENVAGTDPAVIKALNNQCTMR